MNVLIREETLPATVVELLDIETFSDLEQFKTKLVAHGFGELYQIVSPDGTALLCLSHEGIMVFCDLDDMVGARAKLIDLYGCGNLKATLAIVKSVD